MKKKIFIFSLLLVTILLCSGCNGNVTRDIRHAGFSVSNKFICDVFYKNDASYKKIKYITANNIVDMDGSIYELSLDQVYSNKMNCKKADTSIIVKAIFDDKIVKGKDNKYYYLTSSNNVSSYSLVPATDNSYELYNLLLKDEDVVKVVTADNSKGIYYVLKTDGNVYSYTINRANYNSPLQIVNKVIVYDRYDYKSRIIDFNYVGESSSTYVKTETDVYRMKITNEECNKYADVICKYKMTKDQLFEKYYDKIIAFNGSILITDYKQVFNIEN